MLIYNCISLVLSLRGSWFQLDKRTNGNCTGNLLCLTACFVQRVMYVHLENKLAFADSPFVLREIDPVCTYNRYIITTY